MTKLVSRRGDESLPRTATIGDGSTKSPPRPPTPTAPPSAAPRTAPPPRAPRLPPHAQSIRSAWPRRPRTGAARPLPLPASPTRPCPACPRLLATSSLGTGTARPRLSLSALTAAGTSGPRHPPTASVVTRAVCLHLPPGTASPHPARAACISARPAPPAVLLRSPAPLAPLCASASASTPAVPSLGLSFTLGVGSTTPVTTGTLFRASGS